MAIETLAILWLFAGLFGGAAVGALVGWLTRFETGLAVGLLLPGMVAAWFGLQLVTEYNAFAELGPHVRGGRVVSVRDVPSGGGTQPEPLIEFRHPDGRLLRVPGPRAGGYELGDRVRVLTSTDPNVATRFGRPGQLEGVLVAMMLFGTFLLSTGSWFAWTSVAPDNAARGRDAPAQARVSVRTLTSLYRAAHLMLLGALLWTAAASGSVLARLTQGFALVTLALLAYAVVSWLDARARHATTFALLVLAVNFGVWTWALRLLGNAT